MNLDIIIPTKDRGEVFDQTLRCALNSIQHLNAEIIVVNDSKNSEPTIPKGDRKIRLINNPKSGVASARNAGVRESKGKLLLFLDDDIIISKASVDHTLSLHQQTNNACFNLNWEYPPSIQRDIELAQFGRFMKAHRLTSFKGWYAESWKDNELFASNSVASFHLSISRGDFEKTKGYNEEFPHAGFEDYDFPIRLRNAGLSFYIDSRITVFHNEADRMKLENWLNNQQRRAATRSVAVSMGYRELTLKYGPVKRALLAFISACSGLVFVFLKVVPNYKIADPLYFKLVAALEAAKIFKGYTSRTSKG